MVAPGIAHSVYLDLKEREFYQVEFASLDANWSIKIIGSVLIWRPEELAYIEIGDGLWISIAIEK